ncbi:methylated-DNA--[protein]-cysteine S-methyltransferase [Humibacter sp. BT305]|nr:methylated-DNA--[protein]-cysteine S-methyltransferase [Humibacter sp. BT305]
MRTRRRSPPPYGVRMQTRQIPPRTSRFDTPFGPLLVRAHDGVVHALRPWRVGDAADDDGSNRPIHDVLDAYLSGDAPTLGLPCEATGTPFQCSVWSAVTEIGWGELTTYAALAELIGRPGSARAVGQAVAAHPAPLVLGTHRVVAGDGRLTGADRDAIVWKTALLRLEGHIVHEGRLIGAEAAGSVRVAA